MAKPTERAVKRKPQAVVMLTVKRPDVPNVTKEGSDYEWFETDENRKKFFDQVHEWNKQDAKDHDDMAYLTVEITDTATMKVGRVEVAPENEATKKWKAEVKKDVTITFITEEAKKDAPKKVVRPRKKSTAAKAVQGTPEKTDDTPKPAAARLKRRLAEKKAEAPAAKKPTSKQASTAAKEQAALDAAVAASSD